MGSYIDSSGDGPVDALRQRVEAVLRTQEEHPVYPLIEVLWEQAYDLSGVWARVNGAVEFMPVQRVLELKQARAKLIERERENPLWWMWEPDIWRETDLLMARKRLEHPGVVLELLVTGGIRSGKTHGSIRRFLSHFLYTKEAKVWALDETEVTSKRWRQGAVFGMLPPELRTATGKFKKDRRTKFAYAEGTGFTENMFNLHWKCQDEAGTEMDGGGICEFRFYGAAEATLQGAELTCAAPDELVPRAVTESVSERLLSRAIDTKRPAFLARIREAVRRLEAGERLPPPLLGAIYHSVQLISFTPKEGYSSTVADFMDGATVIRSVPAELLPGKTVPRFKQPKKPTRLIVYLHTYDNPYKGNWDGMRAWAVGKTEEEIRITAYGDVQKNWSVQFSCFRDEHHLVRGREGEPYAGIPREGTWREFIDPARARPWFMCWQLTAPDGRRYLVREWPQEGKAILGVGDPGPWAEVSRSGKKNGDRGPAQGLKLGWGFADYTREIWRIRMEIGAWWHGQSKDARRVKLEWKNRPAWTMEGTPIEVAESFIDSRFANSKLQVESGERTIIESMMEQENAIELIPAPGDSLDEGDQFIISALTDYDAGRPLDALNCPSLRVHEGCRGIVFAMHNFSLEPFRENTKATDEACKDPRDVVAMSELIEPRHVAGRVGGVRGGFSY